MTALDAAQVANDSIFAGIVGSVAAYQPWSLSTPNTYDPADQIACSVLLQNTQSPINGLPFVARQQRFKLAAIKGIKLKDIKLYDLVILDNGRKHIIINTMVESGITNAPSMLKVSNPEDDGAISEYRYSLEYKPKTWDTSLDSLIVTIRNHGFKDNQLVTVSYGGFTDSYPVIVANADQIVFTPTTFPSSVDQVTITYTPNLLIPVLDNGSIRDTRTIEQKFTAYLWRHKITNDMMRNPNVYHYLVTNEARYEIKSDTSQTTQQNRCFNSVLFDIVKEIPYV
jgi:hypothetical protein